MRNRILLFLTLILLISFIPVYGNEFIEGIEITSYSTEVNYMEKIEQCINEGTEHSIKIGKIYEDQRNLKITTEQLDLEKTYIFTTYDLETIKVNFEDYKKKLNEERGTPMALPNVNTTFKSYMSYKTITSTNSLQWRYRQMAWTDSQGFRRINDDYVVAMGTYYSPQCGNRFRIELSSGRVFTAITGDIKDNRHTDSKHMYARNGNVVEFLVDVNKISKTSRQMGDMSYSNFEGVIVSIEKLN